jgi:hypothetical protein
MAQAPDFVSQTKFADGAKLAGHGLALLVLQRDIGFRWIEALDPAGERHGLNTVQLAVRHVVADDRRGPGFADFTANRGIEGHPPHVAAPRRTIRIHALCPRLDFPPIRPPRARAPRPRPLPDSPQLGRGGSHVIQEAADPPPSDDFMQALVTVILDDDGQLLRHGLGLLYVLYAYGAVSSFRDAEWAVLGSELLKAIRYGHIHQQHGHRSPARPALEGQPRGRLRHALP